MTRSKRNETRQIDVVVERTDASLSVDSLARRGGFVTSSRLVVAVGGRRARVRVEVERVAGREALAESRACFGCLLLFERERSVQTKHR